MAPKDRAAGSYYCAVVHVYARVVAERPSEGEHIRFVSCSRHPSCGTFPNGLPENADRLFSKFTGCPFVDTRQIMRWLE